MANKQADKRQGARRAAAQIVSAAAVVLALYFILFRHVDEAVEQVQAAASRPGVSQEVTAYLENEFCRGGLCEPGSWQTWVIVEQDGIWSVEELALLHETLLTTIEALDNAGLGGRALLAGYRFRRQNSEYAKGMIALVNHDKQVVTLADTAVRQLWGFYLYHELGHIVDRRLHLALRRHYHALAGSDTSTPSAPTAAGYWMNEHGHAIQGEAAADAFGLWVIVNFTEKPKPVFSDMRNDTDYEQIASTLETALYQIGVERTDR